MRFDDYNIHPKIKSRLVAMGFNRPTDIQFKAIPAILKKEDVMAIAQTGTGKTGAFVIPILHRLVSERRKKPGVRVLVMVPTRELAKQIAGVCTEMAQDLELTVFGLYGGVQQDKEIQKVADYLDILVATPGRMFDLISQGVLDVTNLETLILDEADLMLALGFQKDIQDILRKIPKKRQTLFFTATIDKKIKSLAYDVVKGAIRIQLSPKNPVAKTVDHAIAMVEMDHKRHFLESILNAYPEDRFLVFVRTKVRAERVVAAMTRVNIDTTYLHGGMEQKERFAVLERFRKGEIRALITTDVAARGIDIPDVHKVVNYDLPENPENYVHRCGRCGRGNNRGQALSFCSEGELPLLEIIERYTGDEISRYEVDPEEYDSILFDADDPNADWQKLLEEDNRLSGTEEEW